MQLKEHNNEAADRRHMLLVVRLEKWSGDDPAPEHRRLNHCEHSRAGCHRYFGLHLHTYVDKIYAVL